MLSRRFVSIGVLLVLLVAAAGAASCDAFSGSSSSNNSGDDASTLGDASALSDAFSAVDAPATKPDAGSLRAVAIAAGGLETCAILEGDAGLKCWGANLSGALGQGDTTSRGDGSDGGAMGDYLGPIDLGVSVPATSVSVGGTFANDPESGALLPLGGYACAYIAGHGMKCWGDNVHGELGLDSVENYGDKPNELGATLPFVDFGQGSPAAALPVTLGAYHTCAVLADSHVKCWGDNGYGELGQNSTAPYGYQAGQSIGALPEIDLRVADASALVTGMSLGNRFSCVVLSTGALKCWGVNGRGQLGLGDTQGRGDGTTDSGIAVLPALDLGAGATVTAVSCGFLSSCAVLSNGELKCWGDNSSGVLGQGDQNARGAGPEGGAMGDALLPVDLGTGAMAKAVSVGAHHVCALLTSGQVKCWGQGARGQLGSGASAPLGAIPNQMGDALKPVSLGTGRTAVAIAVGQFHSCAILDNGGVKCWGDNAYGELGLGDTVSRGASPGDMGDALPYVDVGSR